MSSEQWFEDDQRMHELHIRLKVAIYNKTGQYCIEVFRITDYVKKNEIYTKYQQMQTNFIEMLKQDDLVSDVEILSAVPYLSWCFQENINQE